MKFFVLLATLAAAFAAPAPQEEESPAAIPYVHDEPVETHDIAAEAYAHEDIAAEAYAHEEIEAEPYVHEEPAPVAVAAPVLSYAAYPYAHAYTIPVAAAPVAAKTEAVVPTAPVAYAYA